ncbi:MAG: hypothetical protein LLG04_07635 [Parachlamydia sp.]|nr:hypothetical protein [Parachlamydia sp.]
MSINNLACFRQHLVDWKFGHSIPIYQQAKIMRIAGIALIGFGTVAAVAALTLTCTLSPFFAAGLVPAIAFVAGGILLHRRMYWNDPAENAKRRLENGSLTFDQLITKFGWEKTCRTLGFEDSYLKKKFLEHVKGNHLTLTQINQKWSETKIYGFFSTEDLKPIYQERLAQIPLQDLLLQDPDLILQLKGPHPMLSSEKLKSKFTAEFDGQSLKAVDEKFKGRGWGLAFDLGLIVPERYRQEIEAEFNQLPESQEERFFDKYSIRIVSEGILPVTNPRLRRMFLHMLRTKPFSELCLSRYGFLLGSSLIPNGWERQINQLKAKCDEIVLWESDACRQAREHWNREPSYHTVKRWHTGVEGALRDVPNPSLMMMNGGYWTNEQVPNPQHQYYGGVYHTELRVDKEVRRPARIQKEVEEPWQRFLEANPNMP